MKIVEFLFEKGAKFDQANNVGLDPLSVASQVCLFVLAVISFAKIVFLTVVLSSGGSLGSCRISVRERRQR